MKGFFAYFPFRGVKGKFFIYEYFTGAWAAKSFSFSASWTFEPTFLLFILEKDRKTNRLSQLFHEKTYSKSPLTFFGSSSVAREILQQEKVKAANKMTLMKKHRKFCSPHTLCATKRFMWSFLLRCGKRTTLRKQKTEENFLKHRLEVFAKDLSWKIHIISN